MSDYIKKPDSASTNDAITNAPIPDGDDPQFRTQPKYRLSGGAPEIEPVPESRLGSKSKVTPGDDPKAEHMRFGWLPFYRAWTDEAWFQLQPWSMANLFLWLYSKANRIGRSNAYKKKMIWIPRGCTATSYTKLAELSGLNPKTVKRWISYLVEAGELEVQKSGADGIIVRLVKFDDYAFDSDLTASKMANEGSAAG